MVLPGVPEEEEDERVPDEYIKREDVMKTLFAPEMCYTPVQVKIVKELPAADVAPVVRCKDCKYFGRELENGKHGCTDFNLPYCRPDDFCSHGEQKEATSTDE